MKANNNSHALRLHLLHLEQLENRTMLDGHGIDPSENVVPAFRQPSSEFLRRVNYENVEAMDSALFTIPTDVVFRPTIIGGSENGTPPDSPEQRVDPNSPAASKFGGIVSVEIVDRGKAPFLCTGTLIAPSFVLTAAHCFDFASPNDGDLDFGILSRILVNDGSDISSVHSVTNVHLHPSFQGFNTEGAFDDIALLELATPVPDSTPIYPIRATPLMAGETITFAAYGQSGTGDTGATIDGNFTTKRAGYNVVDLFVKDDDTGEFDEIFIFDFDEPTGTDVGFTGGSTLGNDKEANIALGDSGAAAFVEVDGNLMIAGLLTVEISFENITAPAGFFGSLGGGIVLSPYIPWIESLLDRVQISGSEWAVTAFTLFEGENRTLPWTNLNTITVEFNEPRNGDAPSLLLENVTDQVAPIQADLVSWDGMTASYQFDVLTNGYYRATLDGDIHEFGVLHADSSGSNDVDLVDLSVLADRFSRTEFRGPAPSIADYNGSGLVDLVDLSLLAHRFGTMLGIPAALPPQTISPLDEPLRTEVVDDVWAERTEEEQHLRRQRVLAALLRRNTTHQRNTRVELE